MVSQAETQAAATPPVDSAAAEPVAAAGPDAGGAAPHADAPRQPQQQRSRQRPQRGSGQHSSEDVDWWVQPGGEGGSSEDYSSEDEAALGLETAPPDFYDPAADEKVGHHAGHITSCAVLSSFSIPDDIMSL